MQLSFQTPPSDAPPMSLGVWISYGKRRANQRDQHQHRKPSIYHNLRVPILVGGFNHLEKYVNGKDYPIYSRKIKHVPNHQPAIIRICILHHGFDIPFLPFLEQLYYRP